MSFCANLERDLPSLATIVSEKTDLRQRDEILEDQDLELFRRSLRNREQLCHQWGRPMTTLDIQEIEFQFRECVGNRYAYSEQISSVEKYHQEFCEWKRWMGILYGWEDPEEVVVSIFIRGLKESIRSKMSSPLASSLNCAYLEAIAIELSMRRMDPCLEKKSYGVDPNPLQDDANRDLEWQMLSANVKEKEPEDGRSLENDVSAVQNHVSVVNCISTVEVNKSLRMIDGFYEIDWDEKEVVAELVALSLDAKLLAVNDLYLVVENESKGHRFGSHGKELWNVAYDNFQKAIVEVDYTNGWQLCNDTKHMFLGKLLVHDPGGQCCFNSRLRSRHLNSFEDPCFDTVSEVLKFSIATICNDLGWQDEHTDDMVYDPGGISIHKHEKSLMGGGDKSLANHNSLQRVKVYRLNDDGKWDDQGTGHVTIDYMERSECLFVTDGETDVKVYTVGPEYAHADARKSRGVDGVVMTNFNGKEVRYLVLLEFAGTEDMIQSGEKLFGDYDWGRFDLLVLPPSFPYGRMENPRMVFLTPTVLKGDASGAQVVAHELAHSWTGNLITNKNNEHFWLNEGFTTYAERRIVEAVQGNDIADLNIGIGWRGLNEEMERFKYSMEFTKLKLSEEGVDPDDIYSQVPYEKGFQFLWRIERQVGRPAIEEFLKKYIANFKFQQIDTVTFLDFLKANVPSIENEIDLKLWTEGTGIPPDAYEPVSNIYTKILSLANDFRLGRIPEEGEVADWKGQEWELYLENLPKSVEPSQVSALDARYRLSESTDYEVKVAFLQLAISSQCKDYYSEVEKTLKEVGRMKYLRPLYTSLVQGTGKEEEKIFAKRVFSEARDCYHPIAQGVVESIFSKHL